MGLTMKNFNFWGSLKNPIFRVGLTKNQYRGGNCLKRGAWTVCRFKGETWQERGGGVFEEGEGVDTLMHTMCTFYVCPSCTFVTTSLSGTMPSKSTLSELNKWFYWAIGNSWGYI